MRIKFNYISLFLILTRDDKKKHTKFNNICIEEKKYKLLQTLTTIFYTVFHNENVTKLQANYFLGKS
jgi:hypothetical protein